MRKIKASEFKARCLEIIDEVAATGEPVMTKRGGVRISIRRDMADAAPEPQSIFGCMPELKSLLNAEGPPPKAGKRAWARYWGEVDEKRDRPKTPKRMAVTQRAPKTGKTRVAA